MHEVLKRHTPKQLKSVAAPNLASVPAGMKETAEKSYAQPLQSIRKHYRSDISDKLCFLDSVVGNNHSIDTGHAAAIGHSSNIIQRAPIEVAERETKETDILDPVIFPGLDSCLGITIKIGDKVHAAHLVMPFDTDDTEIYCKQVDTIYQLYFAAPAENRDLHISYKSDATILGSTPTNSHHEVLEHTSILEQLKSLFQENIETAQAKITVLEKSDSEIEEIVHEVENRNIAIEQEIELFVNCIKKIETCIAQLNTLKEEEASYSFGLSKNSEGSRQTGNWRETRSNDITKNRWLNTVSYQPPQATE